MKIQKGLGRGLDAIFGAEVPETDIRPKQAPMSGMEEIDIDNIIPNPSQPRKEFDE